MSTKLKNSGRKLYLAHRRASASCDAWAAKAMRYRQSGQWRRAEMAEGRTFQCLIRMKQLADRWDVLNGLGSPTTVH